MATFEGSLKEFNDFVGPVARNIVCNLSRKHKQKTTCRHEGCNKRKPLEAAHIKGKERPVIIGEILKSFQKDDDLFLVDLNIFKAEFIKAHTPIEDVILPMCKEHHMEYDKKEQIDSEYPIILDEFETEDGDRSYTEEELTILEKKDFELLNKTIQKSLLNTVKDEVSGKYGINKSQIAFSRISESNGLWNFDINKQKFEKDFAFIFYNQITKKFNVGLIKGNTLVVNNFSEKNDDVIRFFVNEDLKDRSGFDFNKYLVE
ncbi:MAG: hypothetical protein ACOH2D_10730 [Gelidibacter sp.]